MPVLTPTADLGARSRSVGATSVDPAGTLGSEEAGRFLADTGLNGPFVADLLSSLITHERCGVHLYRSVASRTQNPVLERKYEHNEAEELRHLEILEELVTALGGDPLYVSPIARVTEKAASMMLESTFLLGGSVDPMDQEMVMLDAVFLAEAKDNANWATLGALVASVPSELRDVVSEAVEEARATEAEHLEWAKEMRIKMMRLQASSSTMAAMGAKTEEIMARIKGWFS